MTTNQQVALPVASSFCARWFAPAVPRRAANDNSQEPLSDLVVRAALTHFSRYGLGAAENARDAAKAAFFANDRDGYDWWMAICRTLDRRIAARLNIITKS
jgi:hypothetical protein